MTVADLIETLRRFPQDAPVGTKDFGQINGAYLAYRIARDPGEPNRVVYLGPHSEFDVT